MLEHSSPASLSAELGSRLKHARLNADLTQAEVADRVGVSRKVVMNAEKGKVQLEAFVAIMLALDLASQLNAFLPKPEFSPIQLAKLQGRKRQRASRSKVVKDKASPEW